MGMLDTPVYWFGGVDGQYTLSRRAQLIYLRENVSAIKLIKV